SLHGGACPHLPRRPPVRRHAVLRGSGARAPRGSGGASLGQGVTTHGPRWRRCRGDPDPARHLRLEAGRRGVSRRDAARTPVPASRGGEQDGRGLTDPRGDSKTVDRAPHVDIPVSPYRCNSVQSPTTVIPAPAFKRILAAVDGTELAEEVL